MAHRPAHPGPRDGSGPLVWIIGGICVALIVLVLKLSFVPGAHDQAIAYVAIGGVMGFLLHLLRRRRRKERR